jgi:hypothetical protein
VHSQSCTSLAAMCKPSHSLMPAKHYPQVMATEAEPSHAQHPRMWNAQPSTHIWMWSRLFAQRRGAKALHYLMVSNAISMSYHPDCAFSKVLFTSLLMLTSQKHTSIANTPFSHSLALSSVDRNALDGSELAASHEHGALMELRRDGQELAAASTVSLHGNPLQADLTRSSTSCK